VFSPAAFGMSALLFSANRIWVYPFFGKFGIPIKHLNIGELLSRAETEKASHKILGGSVYDYLL